LKVEIKVKRVLGNIGVRQGAGVGQGGTRRRTTVGKDWENKLAHGHSEVPRPKQEKYSESSTNNIGSGRVELPGKKKATVKSGGKRLTCLKSRESGSIGRRSKKDDGRGFR